mmetsp:Transcript_2631/g.4797  ORF Transcript_2631/g.4797 Transcript_2631/m.4797 type:complete len:183 (+) Transcript_2631:57-605(+)|eukprot:CAMPEP_0114423574 /NCGR_PEP_ID=MMETSP0103-20121206/6220_1 /TAXON_ID=37642 ORGANISM="Paraphysomonas imperforata, Strain PA2" /NCGR_SAMPLE_ID=MMETSP0103 /ASSEMBLY_ACC=CAM_ASM_000201 /LENGTH=182 /DNA_ID=CAMNT_0001592243 /DNA_START=52 /DNA_END=600 /DNA_ORIENTATION=+
MELSQRTLSDLGSLETLEPENLSKIYKYFIQIVNKSQSSITLETSAENEQALGGLSTLLLEAARVRASGDQIKNLFAEHSLSPEIAETLSSLYDQQRGNILAHLEATGIAAPMIVGIDWRLDYSVRSKHGGRNNVPMYFVSLKVKDRGLVRNIDMIANLQEMQDMLSSVRDAVKQVERVLAI